MRALLPFMLLAAGVALFVTGLVLPRYHDKDAYEHRYMALEGPTRSKDFYELRRQSLTSSLKFQDYGLTVILTGVLVIIASRWRQIAPALPTKKVTVVILGTVAAFVTMAAQVGALFIDYVRGEFPHWADSMGIPLAGTPVMFLALVLWAGVHSLLVEKNENPDFRLHLRRSNWWLAFLVTATVIILFISAASGNFWQIIPAALWVAFYLSIWISRSKIAPTS